MTPSECRPGTVVMWGDWVGVVQSTFNNGHGVNRARVSNWERVVPLVLPDEVEVYDDQQPGETVDCEDLRLAPRFLVEGGEWIAKSTGKTLIGIIDPPNEHGWPWIVFFAHQTSIGDVPCGNEPTYLAARQAVERACGVER